MTVSAPCSTAQRSFASSHAVSLEMGELPRFALIFVRVADADPDRLQVPRKMIPVSRDDKPSASHFVPDGFGGQVFNLGDAFHLRRDDTGPRLLNLRCQKIRSSGKNPGEKAPS